MQQEIWKDIPDYKGYYQVSNLGRVKGLKYTFWAKKQFRTLPERILKPNKNKNGYFYVVLHKNKKGKTWKVHKLVALAFIPNPENKKCIDHIDTNKENNNVNNLRWCTHKENMSNSITKKKLIDAGAFQITKEMREKAKIGYLKNKKQILQKIKLAVEKPIKCIETEKIYKSITTAATELQINPSNISAVCKGKLKSAGGYHWKYIDKKAC